MHTFFFTFIYLEPSSGTPTDITVTAETPTDNATLSQLTSMATSPDGKTVTTQATASTQANTTEQSGIPRPCPDVPDNAKCEDLEAECLECNLNENCTYGKEYNVTCRPKAGIRCLVSNSTTFCLI